MTGATAGSGAARPSVLFVCVHNAGRSQMAAGFLRHLGAGAVEVRSAGSMPAEHVNPAAVEAMREVGIDLTDQQPKVLTPEAVQSSDVVITMGCGDACPFYPGKRYEDWVLDDPAGQGIEAVRPIRDEIRHRVVTLLASLGIDVDGAPDGAPDVAVAVGLGRLRDALHQVLPEPTSPFRPPATDAALDRLAAALGRPVPDELAALLRTADGQVVPSGRSGPLNHHYFLGVEEIIAMHGMLDDVVSELSEPAAQPSAYSQTIWSSAWIPFLANEGDCYAIDLAPGELGVPGQVFYRPNVPDLDEPVAPSLSAFLHKAADVVESGAHGVVLGTVVAPELY